LLEYFADPHVAFSMARIEAHYFVNRCFIEQDQILRDMPRISHLPGFIVHGRYDAICPIDQAFALHQRWPGSEFKIIGDAGHAASEPDVARALVASCDEMLHLLDESAA
jgi:proline iminopeptidase